MIISQVPSGGKSYPEGTKFSVNKYTLGDLKKLGNDMTLREHYDFILKGVDTNLPDKMDLSLYDANYFGIQRRLLTMNQDSFRFVSYCEKCKKRVIDVVPTGKISFYDLDAPELPVNVKISDGTMMSFGVLTVGNFLDIMEENDNNPDWDMYIAAQCVSHPYDIALQILRENTNPDDLPVLEKLDNILYHGVMPIEVECQELSYTENPGAVLKISELEKLSLPELEQVARDAGLGFNMDEVKSEKDMLNKLILALNLGDMHPCGYKRNIYLGNGGGIALSNFRGDTRAIEDAISYGKVSEHPAE